MLAAVPAVANAAATSPDDPDFCGLSAEGEEFGPEDRGEVRNHESAGYWSVASPNAEADKVWWYANGNFTDVTSQDPDAGSRLYLDKTDPGPITVFYLVNDSWQYIHAASVDSDEGPTFGDLSGCTPPPSGDGGTAPGDDGPTGSVTEEVDDGGTVSTDPDGTGPTEDDPVTTSVTTPNGGTVTIEFREPTGAEVPGEGFVLLDLVASIDAPAATANEPLQLKFSLHSSIVPTDVATANLITFRNGVPVPSCSGASGIADPDPCVALVEADVDGNVEIEVVTSNASVWSFAEATSACPTGIVPADGFSDDTGFHGRTIACVIWWQLADGFGDGTFGASLTLTRAQGATFIARLLDAAGADMPEDASHAFVDVEGSVHETAIGQLSTLNIISGIADDRFVPHGSLSRAQMAALLVRTYEHVGDVLPAGADAFDDDDGSVHEVAINKAAAAGFTTGVTLDSFDPHGQVSRGQMASFLTRVLDRFFTDGEVTLPR